MNGGIKMKNINLPDIQNSKPDIDSKVDKVGVREVLLPFKVKMKDGGIQHTVADISAYVTLLSKYRGINMSRILRVLNKYIDIAISSDYIDLVLKKLRELLQSPSSYLKVKFKYFLKRKAPISGSIGYVYYPVIFEGELLEDGTINHYLTVSVDYTSLCECSKEISEVGAHNQRSNAEVKILYQKENPIWIEDIVDIVDKNTSCPIYPVLKRIDEKYVTEYAYKHPRFVETMARKVAFDLEKESRVQGFVIVINHYESIHQHNAVAIVHGGKVFIP